MARSRQPKPAAKTLAIKIVPANKAKWEDIEAILGGIGYHGGCWCQRFKLSGRDFHYKIVSPAQRVQRLKAQTNCGQARAKKTCGLVAYVGGEPAGWCNVEPRCAFIRLGQTPWKGRDEDPRDETIWAVTCFVVRAPYRSQHLTYKLAKAAVAFARERGARTLEGYAMITEPGKDITWGEVHVGPRSAFIAAGFKEAKRVSKRRAVMRIDF